MTKMYDSGQEEASHRGNDHRGMSKSYHMSLADQMDAQANGSAWPSFMKTKRGAAIAVVAAFVLIVLILWLITGN